MPISQIKQVAPDTLRPHPSNARTHPKKQRHRLAKAIQRFGFTVPIIVDENSVILAGHGRWLVANELGLPIVPVLVLSGLSEAERRAYLLADNKLAENAGWDKPALAVELASLAPLLTEIGLDITDIGFEPVEIDALMGDHVDSEADPADELPQPCLKGSRVSPVSSSSLTAAQNRLSHTGLNPLGENTPDFAANRTRPNEK